ncbi:unnamed protein product [Meloidogyne enterolobii]|uniref:Uncharacterized protein n=1 Tax=Meloidogyne enterolobii TaxID=390850 RepID=A0ACB0ZU35_MELEN
MKKKCAELRELDCQYQGQQQSTNSPNTHLNGNDIIDVTPKNVNIPRIKQQTTTTTAYEDFKIPANFVRNF